MRLPIRHHFCIWCGSVLSDDQRSDEHIIPDCLGGRLKSPDVCRVCNSRFGSDSDWRLLNDRRIYTSAMRAGVPHDQFLRTYEAIATTGNGQEVRLRVTDGTSRVIGGLGAKHVHIGSDTDGAFAIRDVASLRALRKSRAKLKCPHLDPLLVDREIDRMVDAPFESGPAKCPYSPLLGEGFALSSTSNDFQVTRTFLAADT